MVTTVTVGVDLVAPGDVAALVGGNDTMAVIHTGERAGNLFERPFLARGAPEETESAAMLRRSAHLRPRRFLSLRRPPAERLLPA